jgi:hypothetical protein
MAVVPFQQYDVGGLYLERIMGYEPGMGLAQPVMYATPGVQTSPQLPGGIRGLKFPKITQGPTGTGGAAAGVMSGAQTMGALFFVMIPSAMTTGLTFTIHATDDGTNPADLGLVAVFGIQTKVLTAASHVNFGVPNYATTSPFLNAPIGTGADASGQETSATITLGATAGLFTSAAIAIITANLGTSAAANSVLLCKIRRIGMATTDTLQGSVLVTGVNVATY